jgi:hypothetical protein
MCQASTIGTPQDYSDSLYHVYFEIGEYQGLGKEAIERFLPTRCNAGQGQLAESSRIKQVAYGYEVDIPIQVIPEIVRELSKRNVAVYQVVRTARDVATGG